MQLVLSSLKAAYGDCSWGAATNEELLLWDVVVE
jgi:hypothetical protein